MHSEVLNHGKIDTKNREKTWTQIPKKCSGRFCLKARSNQGVRSLEGAFPTLSGKAGNVDKARDSSEHASTVSWHHSHNTSHHKLVFPLPALFQGEVIRQKGGHSESHRNDRFICDLPKLLWSKKKCLTKTRATFECYQSVWNILGANEKTGNTYKEGSSNKGTYLRYPYVSKSAYECKTLRRNTAIKHSRKEKLRVPHLYLAFSYSKRFSGNSDCGNTFSCQGCPGSVFKLVIIPWTHTGWAY